MAHFVVHGMFRGRLAEGNARRRAITRKLLAHIESRPRGELRAIARLVGVHEATVGRWLLWARDPTVPSGRPVSSGAVESVRHAIAQRVREERYRAWERAERHG